MPRRPSQDKRAAILQAAASVIATRGLSSAPTSAIAKAAGVAEGTLFLYFRTKNDLANALYLELKTQLTQSMFTGQPASDDVRRLVQHHWDQFIAWGVEHPDALRALDQLSASGLLTGATLAALEGPYRAMEKLTRSAIRSGTIRMMPLEFLTSTFETMAQNTIRQIHAGVGTSAKLRRLGFQMLWRAIATESL